MQTVRYIKSNVSGFGDMRFTDFEELLTDLAAKTSNVSEDFG